MASIFADKDFYPVYHICFVTPRDDLETHIVFEAENPEHYDFNEAILTQKGLLDFVKEDSWAIQGFYRYKLYPNKPTTDNTQLTPIDEDMCLLGQPQCYALARLENSEIVEETIEAMTDIGFDAETMKGMEYILSGMKYMTIETTDPTLVFNENMLCTRCAEGNDLEALQIESGYILQQGQYFENIKDLDLLRSLISDVMDYKDSQNIPLPKNFAGIEYF